MVLDQSGHRTWDDFLYLYAIGACNFCEYTTISARVRPYEANRFPFVVVLQHIAAEKGINAVAHKLIDIVLVEFIHQEARVHAQGVARQRVVVDRRHYLIWGKVDIFVKLVAQLCRSNVLQAVAKKALADVCRTTLITKDITQ